MTNGDIKAVELKQCFCLLSFYALFDRQLFLWEILLLTLFLFSFASQRMQVSVELRKTQTSRKIFLFRFQRKQ